MELQHCFKCLKQIEFRKKGEENILDDKKCDMNKLEAHADYVNSAYVFEFWYCGECWIKIGSWMQMHGYLPRGMDGFSQVEEK